MIGFFRRIRKKLANENQFVKYSRYAIGEIVLVMVGILLALYVNNWNENLKQEATFKSTLEQLYNTLKMDAYQFENQVKGYNNKIETIDFILTSPDSIDGYHMPYVLYSLTMIGEKSSETETAFHVKDLTNGINNKQKEISKQIINYVSTFDFFDETIDDDLVSSLKSINLAFPKVDADNLMTGWVTTDSTYYSENDDYKVIQLVHSNAFKATIKTMRTRLIYFSANAFKRYGDAVSLRKLIKDYHPKVKLLFKDVGVKGTAIDGFDNVYGKSTPMLLTDVENDIWELDIYLLKGAIKFRCRDSWAINWGAGDFPKGVGFFDGPDIIVAEEGNYHIIFKPVTGEYEFFRITL